MTALVQAGASPRGEDYIDEISRLKTQFDVFRFMKGLTEAYRLPGFHGGQPAPDHLLRVAEQFGDQ
jgi:hypothetical protein